MAPRASHPRRWAAGWRAGRDSAFCLRRMATGACSRCLRRSRASAGRCWSSSGWPARARPLARSSIRSGPADPRPARRHRPYARLQLRRFGAGDAGPRDGGDLLSREQELRICEDLIGRFAGALQSPRNTPVPSDFQPLWNELRGAVDGPPDPQRAVDLLLQLPKNSSDPGSPTYVGYVPDAALPLARTVDGFLSAANAVAAGRIDGQFAQAEYAIADRFGELAGFPADTRGGTFVQGGTLANFCAIAVARERWRRKSRSRGSPVVIGSRLAHSALKVAARLLDLRFVPIEATAAGQIDLDALAQAVEAYGSRIAAV